jgi:putative membrane protein insertion efficiency factor
LAPDAVNAAPGLAATAVRRLLIGLIRLYQLTLSPWFGRTCRFEPTCSHYATEALQRFGVRRGLWLTLRRLGRCHPWGGSGYDPVPSTRSP